MEQPRIILLISGKRKCGKDFIAAKLQNVIGDENCTILRISEPIKSHYAKENNLNLDELMSDNSYKEIYRLEMIKWSDAVRSKEPGYFCKVTCSKAPLKKIWIVSDIRRQTDIKWFIETYTDKVKTIRIQAELNTRSNRGWCFTDGVDNVMSECDLDDYHGWDLKFSNNTSEEMEDGIKSILKLIGIEA